MIGERERLWDPSDPAFRANPYPFYDRLRTEAPVYRAPGGPLVISRYDDIVRVLRSNAFSRDVEANARFDENDVVERRRRERRGGAKTILNLDPPDHTRLRRLVSKAFTPSAVDRLRPRIVEMVDAVLDRAAERGEFELVDELAFPVPFQVISELLDMPSCSVGPATPVNAIVTSLPSTLFAPRAIASAASSLTTGPSGTSSTCCLTPVA